MVASRPREPRPASPDPYQPNRARDRAHRRTASRPHVAASRQARLNLDSLAIGAPLTAALIGVLLTEGDAALGGLSAGSTHDSSAARRGDGEAGGASHQQIAVAGLGAAAVGLAGDFAASTSGEIFDPVATGEASALAAAGAAAAAGTLAPPGATSAGVDAKAALSAGTSITFGAGGALDDLSLDGGAAGANGAQSDGRIGATITGTAGDDVIHGTPHDDRLFGGAGNDTIYGYEGDDLLDGGAGDDQLFGGPGRDTLLGGTGRDQLFGGAGDDRLLGGSGNDRLFGEEGRDWLDGGPGDDRLDGGPDADRMIGGAGNDLLMVNDIHDVAFGDGSGVAAPGNNALVVQDAFATHLGQELGEERATFVFSENLGQTLPGGVAGHNQQVAPDISNITFEGTVGHDAVGDSRDNRITGNDGDNALFGGGGDDVLSGGVGSDLLDGGGGRDLLEGGSGNDILKGGSSADELYGGDGDDILAGGLGADMLYGEGGNDTFMVGLNDSDVDWVFDQEGRNQLSIEDGAGHLVQTAVAGEQLYVVVDKNPVTVVDGYVGHEDAFEGVDTGTGLRSVADLMAPNAGAGPALTTKAADAATSSGADDLLESWLTRPSLQGGASSDYLNGTSAADWLSGHAGDDVLRSGDGRDVLEGGAGNDLLEGGGGDDRYLFKSGDFGWNVIRDSEGSNVAELDGFAGARLKGIIVDQDLVLVANNSPLFAYENFVGNEHAFAGVQIGDQFVATEDLLA